MPTEDELTQLEEAAKGAENDGLIMTAIPKYEEAANGRESLARDYEQQADTLYKNRHFDEAAQKYCQAAKQYELAGQDYDAAVRLLLEYLRAKVENRWGDEAKAARRAAQLKKKAEENFVKAAEMYRKCANYSLERGDIDIANDSYEKAMGYYIRSGDDEKAAEVARCHELVRRLMDTINEQK